MIMFPYLLCLCVCNIQQPWFRLVCVCVCVHVPGMRLLLLEGFFILFFDSGGSDVKRGAGGEEPVRPSSLLPHSKNSPPTTLHLMHRFHIQSAFTSFTSFTQFVAMFVGANAVRRQTY